MMVRSLRPVLLAALGLMLSGAGRAPSIAMTPRTLKVSVRPERARAATVSVTIDAGEVVRSGLDVLFLFDQSGSMAGTIDVVRQHAAVLMDRIAGLTGDVHFGLASFDDYAMYGDLSNSGVWFPRVDLGPDRDAIRNALSDVQAVGYGDPPEAYCRALDESSRMSWRPRARKFIVLFGDAQAHDDTFYGLDLGVDPGRDEVLGTGDDLRLVPVLDDLAAKGIRVITIHGDDLWPGASVGFLAMASRTGGMVVPVAGTDEVPDAIVRGLDQLAQARPILEVPAAYARWVTIGLPSRPDATSPWDVPISFHPPRGTANGRHVFPLEARSSGNSRKLVARTQIELEVAANPWGYQHIEYWSPWPTRRESP